MVDDFTRECVQMAAEHGISSARVVRLLHEAACFRGYPAVVCIDNGPGLTSRAFLAWMQRHGIRHHACMLCSSTQSRDSLPPDAVTSNTGFC